MNKIVRCNIMEIKKMLLKIAPYVASVLAGFLFYFIGVKQSENIRGLLTNISAVFLAIPLIYFFYQAVHNFSEKRLNKEIFDYAKMLVDSEILSLMNQLYKMVHLLEEKNFTPKGINNFLSLRKEDVEKIISKNEYLGFQIFKNWRVSQHNLRQLLQNSYIVRRLENEQIISIISILKSVRYLQIIQRLDDLYLETEKKASSYRIVNGKELDKDNIKFPDRLLLLKNLGDDRFLVGDFGDFPAYYLNNLLQNFKVNERHLKIYADAIFDSVHEISNWVRLTGEEFVMDTERFRLGHEVKMNNLRKGDSRTKLIG